MTVTKNHPRRRCPKCHRRKRIRKELKTCYMCRASGNRRKRTGKLVK